MQVQELIDMSISEGKAILQELETMRESDGAAINVVYYKQEDVERCRKRINKWQLTSREILICAFGESHRHVVAFEDTISRKDSGFNYKHEFQFEMNQGLSVLESVSESLNLGLNTPSTSSTAEAKTPMVFISHSSKDKEFAEALVVLLEDLGFDRSNLFCSSVDGYGIELSEDIFEILLDLFNEHNLFVIFIHSPRYYKSPISLNEMGAAWVLRTDFCSFLTKDMDFSMMKGVVNGNTISIKVDSEDTPSRLTELKNKLIPLFGLNQINETKWERKRQSFLDKVLSLNYEPVPEDDKDNSVTFSAEELQIFSNWANNKYDTNYIVTRNRTGLEVHFGYHNCYSFSYGEAEAELEDFMNRLLNAGYVKLDRYDSKSRQHIYKITKQGFDYAKNLVE